MRGIKYLHLILILVGGTVGYALWAVAQSGSRAYPPTSLPPGSASRPSTAVRTEQAPFEERFWNYLKQAQYRNWASLGGLPASGYPGHSPHGEHVKLYVNRTATTATGEFPHGSILVKENYDASGTSLMAITVMYRTKDYAPETGDWYWIKYEPDGRVSKMNNMPVSGRVGMCIDCHRGAGGNDYVFAND